MWMAIAVPLLVGALALALQQVEERLDRGWRRRGSTGCPRGVPCTSAGASGHRRALVADRALGASPHDVISASRRSAGRPLTGA
jgi:hypothetical protein